MVSALWKACSEGHIEIVHSLLKDASNVDVEIKDHNGVTPLIEAIKNGHIEVVRALLEKGANPHNGSSQATPEQYATDPAILELLQLSKAKSVPNGIASHESHYSSDANGATDRPYYGSPPPDAYTYYPSLNTAPPTLPDGNVYYPQPQSAVDGSPGSPGNLPPPEVARFIPCRYFPACRYGAQCIFAHPPQTQFFPGSLPPQTQYPQPYETMGPQPYPHNYYAMSQPSFAPPNGVPHMSPVSPLPRPPIAHARSPSEFMPPHPGHFSPNGPPPPLPYGPMSPSYQLPGPGPVPVPMSIPPLPPLSHQPPMPSGPQSPNMYNNPPPPPSFVQQQDAPSQYPAQAQNIPVYQDGNGHAKPSFSNIQGDNFGGRDGGNHPRRGNRRGSFGARKPPCIFFPSGRCKNGDDCRFPHVIPDGSTPHHNSYFSGRGGGPRPRGHMNGNANGFSTIDSKLAAMTISEGSPHQNGADGSSRSHSTDGAKPRFYQGNKSNGPVNGVRNDRKASVKQRVPNADEFPVLAGSTTPPSRNSGLNGQTNGLPALTAAQIVQAPPRRKDSTKDSSPRGPTPELETKPEVNSTSTDSINEPPIKRPITFAAAATADASKEVSVSA